MDSFNKKLCLVDWTGLYNTDYFVNVHQKHTAAKHRAFSVFIFNKKKELLLKKLALDNPLYPGLIKKSCRSHPAINDLSFTDPMADCAKQAVKYMESEFGIVVDDKDLKWADLVKYHSTQANTTFESMDLSIPDNDVDDEILNKDLGDAPKVFCKDSFVDYEKTYIFYIVKDFVIKPNLTSYSEAFYVDSKKMQTLVNESNCSPWLKAANKSMDLFYICAND